MKRRIEQLLNGIFEYKTSKLVTSVEEIRVTASKGDVLQGSFELQSEDDSKVKGFLYASSARVAYEPSDFFGKNEKILYEIDTTGLDEGEILKGEFTICSNLGEYQIPFFVEMERTQEQEIAVKCASLSEFAALAREDFQKAYVFFVSAEFYQLLQKWQPSFVSLYEGLRSQTVSYRSLEEFLAGCGLKEHIEIKLDKTSRVYSDIEESMKESLVITKNNWGFLKLDIQSDAPFLQIEKEVVTTDEFVGSTYNLEFVLDVRQMHAGKNFGRIRINSGYAVYDFEVEASLRNVQDPARTMHRKQQRTTVELMEAYLDFRLGKKNVQEWLEASEQCLFDYDKAGKRAVFFDLYQVQLLFAKEKMVDACLALEELEGQKERLNTPELEGYYLYLTTFYNRDVKYIDYIEEEIRGLFLKNQENWMLRWLLMYLQEPSSLGPADRFACVREQFVYGCVSPVMYMEALRLIQKEPLLLKRLDSFEVKLLIFAGKRDALNREIAGQTAELALRHKEFDEGLFQVLTLCYEKYPAKDIVNAICSLLIKGHKTEKKYFKWYSKGVSHELRLTGLYENYVETMQQNNQGMLPQIIRMYFAYNNTLGYQKKAMVYANVIRNHSKDPQTYKSYREAMERFMVDQLALGRINRDLALIYDTFLTKAIMNKRMADGLARAIFTYEITCESRKMRSVIVIHNQLKQEIRAVLQEQKACIALYTKDYRILFEDEEGSRYAANVPYTLEKLMDRPVFMEYCKELCPDNPGYVLNICCQDEKEIISSENVDSFLRLLEIPEVREAYKAKLRGEILEFYYNHPQEESRFEYLHKIDYRVFVEIDKKKLIELMTTEGMCKEAFSLVSVYGPEKIDLIQLVRLCSRTILEKEYASDDMLMFLCTYCFTHGKYDETILAYLLKYYDGPIGTMTQLFRAGHEFELDGYDLEEKILIFILFMRTKTHGTEDIFDSYRKKMGKQKICLAYAVLSSYNYFVKQEETAQPVFDYLEHLSVSAGGLEKVCELALLLHYSRLDKLGEGQEGVLNRLMEDISYKGMRFAFFADMPETYTRPYQLANKTYIEYRTDPEANVMLHYRLGGEENSFKTEYMRNMYEGIFVKEFTLFYGEELTYHIVEELDNQVKSTKDCTIHYTKKSRPEGNSQYDLINHMMAAIASGDEQSVTENRKIYLEQSYLVNRLFEINQEIRR